MNIDELNKKNIILLGFGVTGRDVIHTLGESYSLKIVDDNISEQDRINLTLANFEVYDTNEFLSEKFPVDIIIKSPGIKYENKILVKYANSLIINDIELAYLITKKTNIKIVAITGTNGKTSTTSFITELLSNAGYQAFSCGNIGVSPLKILSTKKEIDFLVMELSSFQLKAINYFKPNYAFFLNFSPDHLDYHLTLEDYYKSKLKIFKNVDSDDHLFINKELNMKLNYENVHTSDYKISEDLLDSINGIYTENVRLVVQFANMIGIDESTVIDTFKNKFKSLPHRMEFISKKNGVKYINDSKATNLEATKVALKQFDHIVLLVGGYEKGEDLKQIKKCLGNVDYMISYGTNRHQFDGIIENYSCVETLDKAFEIANKVTMIGSTVLLSPCSASYDQFENYEHRGDYFRELVLKV